MIRRRPPVRLSQDCDSVGSAAVAAGACPPVGSTHRYIFTIHALSVEKLNLDPDSSAAMVGFMAGANGLGKATLTVTYGR
jgi:phosphatidylethanolamine-binding protein (PEBP) family uncharacterized protein